MVSVLTADGPVRAATGADPLATGDWVLVADGDESPVVVAVLPRHSAFVRGDPMDGTARNAQVVAANIDTVFVTQSFDNGPNLRRLERELVLAFESGAEPVIVLTKADLAADADRPLRGRRGRASGAPVIVTSAVSGAGIDGAPAGMRGSGRTVALIGASGVGKSTLVNCARRRRRAGDRCGAGQRPARPSHDDRRASSCCFPTAACSSTRRGCARSRSGSPTTASGARSPTSKRWALECRFHDCAHDQEPGCAVQLAVARGEIDAARVFALPGSRRRARPGRGAGARPSARRGAGRRAGAAK